MVQIYHVKRNGQTLCGLAWKAKFARRAALNRSIVDGSYRVSRCRNCRRVARA